MERSIKVSTPNDVFPPCSRPLRLPMTSPLARWSDRMGCVLWGPGVRSFGSYANSVMLEFLDVTGRVCAPDLSQLSITIVAVGGEGIYLRDSLVEVGDLALTADGRSLAFEYDVVDITVMFIKFKLIVSGASQKEWAVTNKVRDSCDPEDASDANRTPVG